MTRSINRTNTHTGRAAGWARHIAAAVGTAAVFAVASSASAQQGLPADDSLAGWAQLDPTLDPNGPFDDADVPKDAPEPSFPASPDEFIHAVKAAPEDGEAPPADDGQEGGPPPNDMCGNPQTIPSSSADIFQVIGLDTSGATSELCEYYTCGGSNKSVWYLFTPNKDGKIDVDTNGSNYDTVLGIFDDCFAWDWNTLSCTNGSVLACDDDGGNGVNSKIDDFPVLAGHTYKIRVSSLTSSSGFMNLFFLYVSFAPENDECSDATVIPSNASNFNPPLLDTTYASSAWCEAHESCEGNNAGTSKSVWYHFVAPSNGKVSVNTNGSSYDTVLSIFDGWCAFEAFGTCYEPAELACDDDSGSILNSQIVGFPVLAGESYDIKVSAYLPGGSGGDLDFNFSFVPGQTVTIVAASPPLDNPFVGGTQPFRDVLQTGTTAAVTQGIGAAGTPAQDTVTYATISLWPLSGLLVPLAAADIEVACTDVTANGSGDCPTVSSVTGVGAGPFVIQLGGPIPTRECTTLTFNSLNPPGLKIQYQYLPGDLNMNGAVGATDVQALVLAINNGAAALPANLARYNINRSGGVSNTDVLRLVGLLNGVNTSQVWAGKSVAACP